MALKKLSFTKDWTDPEDFPPVAANATQARANIQLLHDETKAYLNETVTPAVDKAAADAAKAQEDAAKALAKTGGLVTVGTTAPEDKTGLWIDTGNNAQIKYYDSTAKAWVTCSAVWK